MVRFPVPEDFFPEFDRIVSDLVQFDRLVISFYVKLRFQADYTYVSGTEIENFEQGTLHDVIEDPTGSWFDREKADHLSADGNQSSRLVEGYNALARSVGLNSVIVAPIRWRGERIGDLVLRSRETDAYGDRHLALSDMLANRISGVVANAQSVTQSKLESDMRKSLLELSRLVSSVRSLQEVQEQFGEIACSLVEADQVSIAVPNAPERVIDDVLAYSRHDNGFDPESRTEWDRTASIAWLDTVTPYITVDGPDDQYSVTAASEPTATAAGPKSSLVAPIVWHGKPIAAISFGSLAERAFNRYHLETSAAVANQIAGAIANRVAYVEMRHESRTRELLAQISRAITSSRQLDSTFDEIGRLITELIPSDRLSITLLAEPGQSPSSVYQYGVRIPGASPGTFPPVLGNLHSLLSQDPVPMVVEDHDPRVAGDVAATSGSSQAAGLRSWLVAPLTWQDTLLGIIHFRSRRENAYSPVDIGLAGQVAQQIAGSVASQVAYTNLAAEAEERESLARIGRVIASTRNLDDTFDQFAEAVTDLIPIDRFSLYLVNQAGEQPAPVLVHGRSFKGGYYRQNPKMSGDLDAILRQKKTATIMTDDMPDAPKDSVFLNSLAKEVGLNSWLVAPIIWRDELIGNLHFRSKSTGAYGARHVRLAEGIASQIAGSIASNIGFQKLEEEAKVRDVLAKISRVVASSDNFESVVHAIEECASTIFDFDGFVAARFDSVTEQVRPIYAQGIYPTGQGPGDYFHISESAAGDAVKSGEVDCRSFTSISQIEAHPRTASAFAAGARTFLTTPMVANDDVIGMLQFRSKTVDGFYDQQIGFASRIADQIAGAFANSLATEQLKFQAVALESAETAIVITTAEGIIEWVNPAFTRLTGWTPAEAVGQHTSIMRSSDPAERHVNDEIWKALRHGRPWSGTHFNRKKDGTEYPEEIAVTPVSDAAGEIIHLVGIKQDVSERIQAHKQREEAIRIESENRELQRIAASRSEFLSTVSHELRTPLTTVSAFADILFNSKSENLTERQMTHLELIRKSTGQLAMLIDDLLDVSQADSGRMVLDNADFELAGLISEAADLIGVLLAERSQVLKLANIDGSVHVNADRSRLMQILTNLLTNASKYSGEGTTIDLGASVQRDTVKITITDRGRGLTRIDKAMMFSPFYRGTDSPEAEATGTGLGLSVVKSLVDLHGGKISVKSKIGKGTSITVEFPGVAYIAS